MHGAREGGTTLAALSHPILVPFLRVTFSPELLTKATAAHLEALSHPILVPFLRVIFFPELLTKATATCLVSSFTVVYDSIACMSWKLPMFCMGSAVMFNCLERTGNHTIPVDFTAFLG